MFQPRSGSRNGILTLNRVSEHRSLCGSRDLLVGRRYFCYRGGRTESPPVETDERKPNPYVTPARAVLGSVFPPPGQNFRSHHCRSAVCCRIFRDHQSASGYVCSHQHWWAPLLWLSISVPWLLPLSRRQVSVPLLPLRSMALLLGLGRRKPGGCPRARQQNVAVCRAHRQGASLRDRRTEHIPTPVRPRTLPESRALGLTGRWVTGSPAVSERRALPARSTDHHQNHALLQSRMPA
jgi:hypothetical protein